LAERPEWTNLGPAYADAVAYAFTYLAGFLRHRPDADLVLVMLGDHQPAASVSGPGAPWEVPVHVITGRGALLRALEDDGFAPGLTPGRPAVGAMHELTALLLRAFASPAPGAGAERVAETSGPARADR
jgi:hypothetical protein